MTSGGFKRGLLRLMVHPAAVLACGWILARRWRYRKGEPLSEEERVALAGFFDEPLLSAVRVCRVHRIAPAIPGRMIRALGLPPSMDVSRVAAMSYGDVVVLSGQERRFAHKHSLLFHELVHSVQYRVFGLRRFLARYIRGWVDADFDYFRIPMELEAFELQERFEHGQKFSVESIVRGGS